MIDESLHELAALYALGALPAREREEFEMILGFHPELASQVAAFEEVTAAAVFETLPVGGPCPCPTVKDRVLAQISACKQRRADCGFVMTDAGGLVHWVNPAFTAMCGYSLDELRGRKLGPILQGAETDPDTAQRMREAVHECRPCHETILNYHKEGHPYWVEIAITPIRDEAGGTRWFIASEREVQDGEKAAA